MKIIFVTRESRRLSGARVRCYDFARELQKHGLETEVFSFADILGAPCGEEELEMGILRKLSYTAQAIQRLRNIPRNAFFYIQRFNYHAFAPLWISILRKNNIIFDCDDWNIREDPRYYLGFYPSSKMEYFTRRMARRARICIAASYYLKEYLGRFSRRVCYIPTGVDTEFFRPSLNAGNGGEVRFSWAGTVYHEEMRENLRFILDCFLSLASRYENITLSIAGEGKYFPLVKAEAGQSRYGNRIVFENWIPPERIPAYLEGIDIGLLPLIQNTKFNRAKSPTKLFEYMSMAKPSVCSVVGEAERIITDGENGMLACSKEEFINKMRLLIEDPALRRTMGLKARQTVERDYSLSILGKRLYDIVIAAI